MKWNFCNTLLYSVMSGSYGLVSICSRNDRWKTPFRKISGPFIKSFLVIVALIMLLEFIDLGSHSNSTCIFVHPQIKVTNGKIRCENLGIKWELVAERAQYSHLYLCGQEKQFLPYCNEDTTTVLASFCPSQIFSFVYRLYTKVFSFFPPSVSNTLWNANYSIYFH